MWTGRSSPTFRRPPNWARSPKSQAPEKWGHIGATESYKQTQFDVANLQLTFHGLDTATFQDLSHNLVQCVKIEPDIKLLQRPRGLTVCWK